MSKILDEYNFNIPKNKTDWNSIHQVGGRGGLCPRGCKECVAYKKQCQGCDILFCPDGKCKGDKCEKCAYICHRAKRRIDRDISFLEGLEIDNKLTIDSRNIYPSRYIPAINKRMRGVFIETPIVSIPFYAIYDFNKEKIICSDIKDYFNISDDTEIIINFYFKDDKILKIFDYLINNAFLSLTKKYKGVKYWHTPCFSVFDISNSMDVVLNFKRQFWVGDFMRDAGINTIQETLYTNSKPKVKARIEDVLEIVEKKGIKNISQCAQLDMDKNETFLNDAKYLRQLPSDVNLLYTGYGTDGITMFSRIRPNMYFSNYIAQYKHNKDWAKYVNRMEVSLE